MADTRLQKGEKDKKYKPIMAIMAYTCLDYGLYRGEIAAICSYIGASSL